MIWLFDPALLLFAVPGLILGLWAQSRIRSAYSRASRIRNRRGLTGAQAASEILEGEGIEGVEVGATPGFLVDHYDPRGKHLQLSEEVYAGDSLAALGIAAHEAGHAIQHARRYQPMYLRSALVPLCTVGSALGQLATGVGIFLAFYGWRLGQWILLGGILGFALVFLFTLITLPVEFNASRRARQILASRGFVDREEMPEVKRVLDAAALTYVASSVAVLGSLLQLIFLYDRNQR